MKVSSQFSVLDNRPIDQWKVTELKEELKRRKLSTRGLKEDLIKRLDEAIREENESDEDAGTVSAVIETAVDMTNDGNEINKVDDGSPQPMLQAEDAGTVSAVIETTADMMNDGNKIKVDDGSPQPMLQAEDAGTVSFVTTLDIMNDGSKINKVDDDSLQPMLQAEDSGTVSAVIETSVDVINDVNRIYKVDDGSPQPMLQVEDGGTVSAVSETTVDMMNVGNKINNVDDGSPQPMLQAEDAGTVSAVIETAVDVMNDGSKINKVDDVSPQPMLQAEDAGTVSAVIETTVNVINDGNKINKVDDGSPQPMFQAEDAGTVSAVIEMTLDMMTDGNKIKVDDGSPQPNVQAEDAGSVSVVLETTLDMMNDGNKINKVHDEPMLQTEDAGTVSSVIGTTVDMMIDGNKIGKVDDGSPQPMLQAEDAGTVSSVIEATLDMMNDGNKINKVDDGSPQPMLQAEDAGKVSAVLETTVDMMNDGNKINKVVDGSPQLMLQTEDAGTVSSVIKTTVGMMIDSTKIIKVNDGSAQPMLQAEDAGTVSAVIETTADMMNDGNEISKVDDGSPQPMLQAEDGGTVSAVLETTVDMMNDGNAGTVSSVIETTVDMMIDGSTINKVDGGMNDAGVDDTSLLLREEKVQEVEVTGETNFARDEEMVLNDTCGETGILVESSVVSDIPVTLLESQDNDSQSGRGDSKSELEYEIKPFHEPIELNSSDPTNQVSEVRTVLGFQVKSDSISTDCVLTNEKIELKDNIIVDNDKLELDVKPEMVQPSSSNVLPDGGKLHPMYVEVLHEKKLPAEEEADTLVANSEMSNKNESAYVVSSEKLIFDRSSGDDSMEEDAFDSRQILSNHNSDEVVDMKETMEVSVVEEAPADVSQDDIQVDNKDIQEEDNDPLAALTVKTKLHDVVSSEKLNLDRSSGDNSIEEEDALDSKPMVSKFSANEVVDRKVKTEVTLVEEALAIDVQCDISVDNERSHDEIKNAPAAPTVKRKFHYQEVIGKNETPKRQRRWWNSENLPEPQSKIASSTTPEDVFPSTTLKRNFSRSNYAASDDAPKERIVPPSPKPPTDSLRIDRFLRPFTIKAVQELLGKIGTVSSFWMDPIKTHCYVTYSSVEEAIETRNAIYNLQWPTNGGRLLVAEFVDPQEVKIRAEASQAPSTPVTPGPIIPPAPPKLQPQPSPRPLVQKEKLPPPPALPPPPPLSNPPQARERLPLPPPSPHPEKVEPPIVTLDDLFKKTKATPRIYYLPFSDEKVVAKLKAQGKQPSSRDY